FRGVYVRRVHGSFPTRRSSDLGVDATGWDGDPRIGWQEAYGIGLSGVEIHARYGVLCHRITWAATATGSPHPWVFFSLFVSRTRSEEHTSELQSRENLVCRLLL